MDQDINLKKQLWAISNIFTILEYGWYETEDVISYQGNNLNTNE